MINHVWQSPHLLTFSTVTVFKSTAEIEAYKEKIKLPISGLLGDTRYYGIVVARIDLFPKEGGFLSPTRSGKVYYDLVAERTKLNESSTAIVRVEQLYPFPANEIAEIINKHPNASLLWVQDEPANQGPWPFVFENSQLLLEGRLLRRVSRRATASPATGSSHLHEEEQHALITEAFSR